MMIRKLISLFCALLFLNVGMQLKAQNQHKLDSLFKLLNDQKVDTIQMKVNRKIARMYIDNNQTKALEYFERAKNIAQKLNRPLETGDNFYSMGYCYLAKGNLEKSLENYLMSVRYYEKLQYDPSLADAYLSIISVYSEMKNFKKAKEYIGISEKLLLGVKDTFQLCGLYSQTGSVYSKEGNQDSALYFMQKGLAIGTKSNDKRSILVFYTNIGLAYKKMNQFDKALMYTDSALSLVMSREDNVQDLAMIFNNLGSIQAQTKQYHLAETNFMKSIELAKQANLLNVEMENYHNLSDMYETMGQYKEYTHYLKMYYHLKDSLFTNDTRNQISQLETDYIVDKKNIELVKKDASIQDQRNQRNLFMLIALGTLFTLIIAIYFNRKIQQKRKDVEQRNKIIQQQKDELQNLNQVKDRLFSVISHDLRNPLNTLQSYLMLSDNESITADKRLLFKNQTIQAVAQTGNLLDNLLTWANMQIRDTSPNVIPMNVQHIVQDVVDVLKPQAEQKQIHIVQELQDHRVVADSDILSIAIRNITTNAIKFSHEKQTIFIQGMAKEQHYLLTIRDEGIGISKTQIELIQQYKNNASEQGTDGEQGSGLGLFLVKQLLNKINVPLLIESEEGKGSVFTLQLTLA